MHDIRLNFKKPKILIVDDDINILNAQIRFLRREKFQVETALGGAEALKKVSLIEFDIVVTDLNMPEMNGLELLKTLKEIYPQLVVILTTGFATIKTAVQAIKYGAYDYIEKPFEQREFLDLIKGVIKRQNLWLKSISPGIEKRKHYRFDNIVGFTPQMHQLYEEIKTVTDTAVSVLILGENGTGKELVADALHYRSKRNKSPYVKINCGAIVETIIESELFGHEKGAYTGAVSRQKGKVESADGGTLFLDEIGDLSPSAQVKLLRVLETGEFQRVGGLETIKADVRLISATNVDLEDEVLHNCFREDLYYRINTVILEIPPLRQRKPDITMLAEYFITCSSKKMNKNISRISNDVMGLFLKYNWPGNVRELSNTIERCVAFCKGKEIILDNLPPRMLKIYNNGESNTLEMTTKLSDIEASHIYSSLKKHNWNLKRVADSLNIARGTLYSKMKKYDIVRPS